MRLLLFLVFLSNSLFADIILTDKTQKIANFTIPYLYDKTSEQTIDTIIKQKFERTSPSQFTFGYVEGTMWFKISLKNETKEDEFFIYFTEPFFETFNFYEYKDAEWKKSEAGLFRPLKDRSVANAHPVFMVKIAPQETKTYYFELSSKFAQVGEFKICTEKSFLENDYVLSSMLYMFYFGGLTIVILLNIFLFITLRSKLYAYYTAYVFFTTLFIFIFSGLDLYLGLAPIHYELHMSAAMLIVFLILFSSSLLETKIYIPKVHKILKLLVYIFLFLSMMIIIDIQPWYQIMNIFATLTFLLLIYTSIKSWKMGQSKAKYYLIIMLTYIITLALFSSVFIGILENNNFNRYAFLFVSFLEISFFSLILANDLHKTKTEKLKIQTELIEHKNLYARNLEAKVKERTSDLEKVQSQFKEQAHRDPLTNLYNRRYLTDIAEQNIKIAKRDSLELSVIILDIDMFKNINDTYGHSIGDKTIIKIAQKLKKIARESDMIFRYGGEEFLLLLPKTSLENATHLAERIREGIENISIELEDNKKVQVTISAGVSKVLNDKDINIEESINRADINLYKAKSSGRNIVINSLD